MQIKTDDTVIAEGKLETVMRNPMGDTIMIMNGGDGLVYQIKVEADELLISQGFRARP